MKTIGLIGGMSWESTSTYYTLLNEMIKEQLGGLHSAKICLISIDFAGLEEYLRGGEWDKIAKALQHAAKQVENGGGDCLVLCTNTMHKVFAKIEQAVKIPCFHIVDAVGEKLLKDGVKRVGLLGTRFTMEDDFFTSRLEQKYGIEAIVPDAAGIRKVNTIIFDELCLGVTLDSSRVEYLRVIDTLIAQDIEAVILGCTEIEMLVKPSDTDIMLYDTTRLHAACAVNWALQ